MSRLLLRAALLAVLLTLPALTSLTARSGARAGCSTRVRVTPRACYPTHISGTFTGKNHDYVWHGRVSLVGHREQVIFNYTGRSTITWKLRHPDIGGGCRLTPASGTFRERESIQVNREPTPGRGWSYATGGAAQGDTGLQYSVCGKGDKESDGKGIIQGSFYLGGFTPDLRHFGGNNRKTSGYNTTWTLRGRR